MSCSRPSRPAAVDYETSLYERRIRAAWLDYLETTRGTTPANYAEIESNAWARLQRRLRRTEERAPQLLQMR